MSIAPKTFAPVLAAMFVLWPVIAYMGGQGFTVALALSAIAGIAYVRVRTVPVFAMVSIAFALWIVASGFWAPEAKALLTGNVFSGSFSLDMPGIRFGLIVLAGFSVVVATGAIAARSSRRSLGAIVAAGLVQFVGVAVTALFTPQILAFFAGSSDPVHEMPQNIMRNANAFALLLPLLLAWLWHKEGVTYGAFAAAGLGILALSAFILTGTQTALVGIFVMLICMALVKVLPKNGFKLILSTLAFYVAAAPILVAWGVAQLRVLGVPLPKSFFSRSYSWELVGSKIADAPFIGHGPEASHTWRDTFGDHPTWLAEAAARYGDEYAWEVYRVIPIHPHNMPLQVWAESGMIGAFLAAGVLATLGWHLKPPGEWPPVSKYAAAGLIGVCTAICSFAYSMWNEAFWAGAILVAAIIYLQARHSGKTVT